MLNLLAWIFVGLALTSAVIISLDELGRPQKMAMMNVVWPATCLYFGPFALWGYFSRGRAPRRATQRGDRIRMDPNPGASITFWQVTLAASHCGAGCALADLVGESSLFLARATLAGSALYASFLGDFVLAWSLGVVFQYFTIKPMRHLTPAQGWLAAIKADTLSISAFQVGMYAWMAFMHSRFGAAGRIKPDMVLYWASMQIAMILGFATSLPMNWLLLRLGWKERMS